MEPRKGSAKSRRAPETPPANSADRLLSRWLQTHEVYDKDAENPEPQESPALNRRRLLTRSPDAIIDLHGLTRDQAWDALEQFFETGRRQAYEKLAIIHGKGNHSPGGAVLKETVRKFIEHCPFAGQSGPSGTGITWVLLKSQKGYRSR
ncbi:MAG: Smr/MutS family protein [Treponema sp.]|nr:Smr/MutS family protein [Treponema sp.]